MHNIIEVFHTSLFPYRNIYSAAAILMSLITFTAFGVDKSRARHHQYRISERTLLLLAFCFGGLGGLCGMHCFHHKTRHLKFRILLPFFFLIQLLFFGWLLYFS